MSYRSTQCRVPYVRHVIFDRLLYLQSSWCLCFLIVCLLIIALVLFVNGEVFHCVSSSQPVPSVLDECWMFCGQRQWHVTIIGEICHVVLITPKQRPVLKSPLLSSWKIHEVASPDGYFRTIVLCEVLRKRVRRRCFCLTAVIHVPGKGRKMLCCNWLLNHQLSFFLL